MWPDPQETVDMVTLTEEIHNFILCEVNIFSVIISLTFDKVKVSSIKMSTWHVWVLLAIFCSHVEAKKWFLYQKFYWKWTTC